MKRCGAKPYEGQEKYIFVSYCHRDRAEVFPIIEQLAKDGYRVWYDEGIDPGSEWPEMIAKHLNGSAICIAFISSDSLNSHNCRREINFALLKKKFFISVVLKPVQMSLGMEMQLSSSQSVFKYTLSSENEFFSNLYKAKELEICKGLPNYSIVVSNPEDYANDSIKFEKDREPFSSRWFAQGDAAEAEERCRAEEAARKAAEDEEHRRAEEAARKAAETEEHRRAEEAARKAAEAEERRRAEEAARKAAEAEERRRAEEAARKAAEAEERRRAEEAARKAAEAEERRRAEEAARKAAETEERRRAEETVRKAAEAEERRRAEEAARKAAETEERRRAEETVRKAEEQFCKTENTEQLNKQYHHNSIHVFKREKTGELIHIIRSPFKIGRSSMADDYVITDNRSISRSHAAILIKDDKCYIVDNNSLNKTFINGSVIEPEKEYMLSNGDSIRLYNERFIYLKYYD